ncbi:MAG: ABC transporter ATP-binding protein [Kiritimatiellia bacterium]
MSSDVVIQVDRLSKQYRLGEVSTGSLGHDLNRWWHRLRGKDDPYLSVTHANVREMKSAGSREYVWAIKDISFEVRQGEVLGIIGRNGAGKSTLLKILSRITSPTTGEVRVKGRVASLLEVGTGFHQDLTGRENIYMNGAVLGMTKQEIRRKLDEIVEFSGCERYIDTPVKRYSSGMVVRLGFAVAAHLEPEILIVDEVLAVGDIEFQKKCLGKMENMAGQGRTVLFVSHNMPAIKHMCHNAILIEKGYVVASGKAAEVVNEYLAGAIDGQHEIQEKDHRVHTEIQIKAIMIEGSAWGAWGLVGYNSPVSIRLRLTNFYEKNEQCRVAIELMIAGECLSTLMSPECSLPRGESIVVCTLPARLLSAGMIGINAGVIRLADNSMADLLHDIASFVVAPPGDDDALDDHARRARGLVRLAATWEISSAS